ncbi:MAG: hypothetical protein VB934_22065, partial [Polyangiaceae bacterium]
YMSPEQARGDDVDHRSDIYAIGIMMYRAFTGKLPFVADTQMGVLTRHLTEAPQLPSEVASVDLITERLILRCLEKRPIDRFQSMLDVVEALDALANRRVTPDPADPSPTLDERSLPRKESLGDRAPKRRARRPPRPSVPPNTEPTPTKIETPQAQGRSGLGRPLPFPPSPASADAQEAAPRSLPPPLPTAEPVAPPTHGVEAGTPVAPGAVAVPNHTSRRSAPLPVAPIHNPPGLSLQPGQVSGAHAPVGAPHAHATPPPAYAAYPGSESPYQLAAATYPESLTNRGVVSSRHRAIGRRRQAQRAAAWVTVGVAGVVIGTMVALVAVDRRDGSGPSPASATNPDEIPSDFTPIPIPSAAPTESAANRPADAAGTSSADPIPSAATTASASAATVAPKPPPRLRQPYRPSPFLKPDSSPDDIRSPFD